MKKIYILLLVLLFSASVFAQKTNRREQVKTLKIAYITEKLSLTSKEAQDFWPIYNDFEDSIDKLRREAHQMRQNYGLESMTEAEALILIKEYAEKENKRQELKNQFTSDLLDILPAKKVILLKKAEEEFKRKMIEEFKRRRQERRN